ncbi:MAG TPA: polyprenyl synthetase family protein [bacterium]|nr:polyprenyl synthetase family protein [bacterium]
MTRPMALDQIYAPVRPDLDALERLFRAELSAEDAFIGELVTHVLATRGKMLRPALVCLSALAAGGAPAAPSAAGPPAGETDDRLGVAGAVELIHVASLIHDDVIDAADLRRGRASVNAVWGNQVAVLLGDFLFSKAFHMLARLRAGGLAAAMAAATVRMAQAEIIQIKYGNTPHTDERIYFGIIDGKTAALTSAACRCGALTAGARPESAEALAAFGLEWGMAFQITDDALDVTATADHLGKPIGSDIQTGRMTLPIILALRDAPEPDGQRLRQILTADGDGAPEHGGEPDAGARGGVAPSSAGRPPAAARVSGLDEVQAILARAGAVDRALAVARARAERAARALDGLPPSAGRDSLAALVEFVTVRTR